LENRNVAAPDHVEDMAMAGMDNLIRRMDIP
jgi:hypothetical protein